MQRVSIWLCVVVFLASCRQTVPPPTQSPPPSSPVVQPQPTPPPTNPDDQARKAKDSEIQARLNEILARNPIDPGWVKTVHGTTNYAAAERGFNETRDYIASLNSDPVAKLVSGKANEQLTSYALAYAAGIYAKAARDMATLEEIEKARGMLVSVNRSPESAGASPYQVRDYVIRTIRAWIEKGTVPSICPDEPERGKCLDAKLAQYTLSLSDLRLKQEQLDSFKQQALQR